MAVPALIAIAAASAIGGGIQAHQAAGRQEKAANRAAEETRAQAERVQAQSAQAAKELKMQTAAADEEARKESLRRRATAGKTLLTGAGGDFTTANTEKKVLLGS